MGSWKVSNGVLCPLVLCIPLIAQSEIFPPTILTHSSRKELFGDKVRPMLRNPQS